MTISNLTKNGRKLSKPVKNTVGKGEIARYEQFLLFLQCFQKAYFQGASKGVIVWEWVKASFSSITTKLIQNVCLNTLPDDKILDWSKLKQIADNILKWM